MIMTKIWMQYNLLLTSLVSSVSLLPSAWITRLTSTSTLGISFVRDEEYLPLNNKGSQDERNLFNLSIFVHFLLREDTCFSCLQQMSFHRNFSLEKSIKYICNILYQNSYCLNPSLFLSEPCNSSSGFLWLLEIKMLCIYSLLFSIDSSGEKCYYYCMILYPLSRIIFFSRMKQH